MRLKTITDNKEELAALIGMSYSGLSNILPKNYYNHPVRGEHGSKEYSLMAHHHYHFRSLLAASPRLSSTGVAKLLQLRQPSFDQIKEQWVGAMKTFREAHPYGIDDDLHSYTLADLELLGRSISTVPCLLPRPEEAKYLEDGPDPTSYIRELVSIVDDIEDDLEVLLQETGISMNEDCVAPFRQALELARKSLSGHLLNQSSVGTPFSIGSLVPLIGRIHHSNAPYFWRDILAALGHKDIKITDAAGDGNRDVESIFQNTLRLSQVKAVRSPVAEETVRQFASTCRTYGGSHGYFVTTLRFVKDAHLGQWPQLSSDRKAELRQIYTGNTTYHTHMVEETCRQERIAEVELVDGQALASYAYRYRIGATLDGMVDDAYWDTLTIPGFRRRTPGYHPLLSVKPAEDSTSDSKHLLQKASIREAGATK